MVQSREIEKRPLKATAWSHLHIHSGELLDRWDYFFDNGRLCLLDSGKLAMHVAQPQNAHFIDEMTKAAEDNRESLHSFLQKHNSAKAKLYSKTRLVPETLMRTVREIRLFCGSPRCYVPGSSIKGAIRTALISRQIAAGKIPLEKNPLKLKQDLLEGFKLDSKDNQFFKNLIIRDTKFMDDKNLGVATVTIYSQDSRDRQRTHSNQKCADTFCEVVLWDTEFEVEVCLRKESNQYGVTSIEDMLTKADQFYRRLWQKEQFNRQDPKRNSDGVVDFYTDAALIPPRDCYLLRLGYGSGQGGTSILIDYQEKFKGDDAVLRQGAVYKGNDPKAMQRRTRTPYPYTAKSATATDGDTVIEMPLGWVTIAK